MASKPVKAILKFIPTMIARPRYKSVTNQGFESKHM